jgi:hypothetical protein
MPQGDEVGVELVVEEQQTEIASQFSVLRLVLGTGKCFLSLDNQKIWLPARVAIRWAMSYCHYRTQSSTLIDHVCLLISHYTWTKTCRGFDLNDYFTQGIILTPHQIEALASMLCLSEALMNTHVWVPQPMQNAPDTASPLIDAGTFDHRLSIAEQLLL